MVVMSAELATEDPKQNKGEILTCLGSKTHSLEVIIESI